ncbi:S-layer homology domain-containing protein [Aureibacillus halotolerans]|uniref:S-layer family protein n=1 Tax=Aureibacillus halotolerans TaxID=1508390 RepID=A0A4R6U8B1_9BACI|nr:S-layer homology domain-containing protein [Aureibacillus halotolerans]TDQ42810.1 S-layer family protein [Aureibacillus halotolerans]
MMKKSSQFLLAVLIVFVVGNTVSPATANAAFSDVSSNHWAKKAITWGDNNNYIKGINKENTLFAPNRLLTRAQWFAMLFRYLEPIQFQSPVEPKAWSSSVLETAVYYGYPILASFRGHIDYSVMNAPINRVEAADTIVYSYEAKTFWYESETVNWMYDKGIAKGMGTKRTLESYAPFESMTRAEGIQLLYQLEQASMADVRTSRFQPNEAVFYVTFPRQLQKLRRTNASNESVSQSKNDLLYVLNQMEDQMDSRTTSTLKNEVNRIKTVLQLLDKLQPHADSSDTAKQVYRSSLTALRAYDRFVSYKNQQQLTDYYQLQDEAFKGLSTQL